MVTQSVAEPDRNQVFSLPFHIPPLSLCLEGRNLEDLIPDLSGFLRFGEQQTKELQAPIPDTHPLPLGVVHWTVATALV